MHINHSFVHFFCFDSIHENKQKVNPRSDAEAAHALLDVCSAKIFAHAAANGYSESRNEKVRTTNHYI